MATVSGRPTRTGSPSPERFITFPEDQFTRTNDRCPSASVTRPVFWKLTIHCYRELKHRDSKRMYATKGNCMQILGTIRDKMTKMCHNLENQSATYYN
ncbi:hypothetical protein OsI_11386 [Oryza sativa Indica Group]|uniref:Uncharacterized protein n=1 Tax=Oryza sativa subsp. indica TaxID=39946 RepID=B8ANG1_ORYSI|nr:hypothetical protein OsI_11386 [Oryza sativa Indica Group]